MRNNITSPSIPAAEEELSPPPTGSLTRRTVGSLAWSAGSRAAAQVLQFAITAVLARLLVPAEFGLIAMLSVFTGFASLFVDLGLAAALIQRKELEERHLSSAFWVNLAAGVAVAAVIAALSPAIAALYNEPRLLGLTIVVGITFIVGSLGIVQSALLQRSLKFRRLALVEIAATVVSGVAAIWAALAGWGVWSLVVLTMTSTGTRSAILWLSSDWRPRLLVDRSAIRELWRFGGNLLGFTTLNYWLRNSDNFLIGKFVGPYALGIYSRAYNTMLLPIYQVSLVTSRVMFPTLSKIQHDQERIKRAYLRAVGLISLTVFPALVGLFVVADDFIVVAYGDRWRAAVPLLRILCVAGIAQSVGTTVGWIYQSQGRTDLMFRWGLFTSVTTVAAFIIGLHWGARGVATAYAIVMFAFAYPAVAIPGRLIGMSALEVGAAIYKQLVASITMGLVVWAVAQAMPHEWPAWLELLLLAGIGAGLYGALLALLGIVGYRDLWRSLANART